MRPIAELLAEATGPTVSVEFFPPKTPAGESQLRRTLADLRRSPVPLTFVSVTYGAGGSTRERTRDLVVELNSSGLYPAMAHLTCIGHTKAELEALLADYASAGIHNILALAGDPPADGSDAPGDFTYAHELVDLIRSRRGPDAPASIAVAAHPELHPRSTDRGEDRRRLAEKLAKADFAITQFFYDSADYFTMVNEVAAATAAAGGGSVVGGELAPGRTPAAGSSSVGGELARGRTPAAGSSSVGGELAPGRTPATLGGEAVTAAADMARSGIPASPGSPDRSTVPPILPGIMPLTNPAGVRRMAEMSRATFPNDVARALESIDDDAERHRAIVDHATQLCRDLLAGGAPGLHLYGLNRSETVLAIIENLAAEGLIG